MSSKRARGSTQKGPKNVLAGNTWPSLPAKQKPIPNGKPTHVVNKPAVPAKPPQSKDAHVKNKSPKSAQVTANAADSRAYVCVLANQSSDHDKSNVTAEISKLNEKVAELEESHRNLMNMYSIQVKINATLTTNISILATYCLLSIDRRMNSYASALPSMMQDGDRQHAYENIKSYHLILRDDGAIISNMLERKMYSPLVEMISRYISDGKLINSDSHFIDNAKLIISTTPYDLLVDKTGAHLRDLLKSRTIVLADDQPFWRELYICILLKHHNLDKNCNP